MIIVTFDSFERGPLRLVLLSINRSTIFAESCRSDNMLPASTPIVLFNRWIFRMLFILCVSRRSLYLELRHQLILYYPPLRHDSDGVFGVDLSNIRHLFWRRRIYYGVTLSLPHSMRFCAVAHSYYFFIGPHLWTNNFLNALEGVISAYKPHIYGLSGKWRVINLLWEGPLLYLQPKMTSWWSRPSFLWITLRECMKNYAIPLVQHDGDDHL